MGTIFVDNIKEHTASNGVHIPGHIIQIIENSNTSVLNTASTTFVDSGFSATITPKFATSKIMVIAAISLYNNTANSVSAFTIYRGSSRIGDSSTYGYYAWNGNSNNVNQVTATYIDSPNSTSATEYKIYYGSIAASGTLKMSPNNTPSRITLMEIAQ